MYTNSHTNSLYLLEWLPSVRPYITSLYSSSTLCRMVNNKFSDTPPIIIVVEVDPCNRGEREGREGGERGREGREGVEIGKEI